MRLVCGVHRNQPEVFQPGQIPPLTATERTHPLVRPGAKWGLMSSKAWALFRDEFLALRADAILGSDESPRRLLPLPAAGDDTMTFL